MTTRSRILRTVGLGAAVLALAGCSTDFHPGSAAVVNDTAITQGQVDDITDAACAYTAALRETDYPLPAARARRPPLEHRDRPGPGRDHPAGGR